MSIFFLLEIINFSTIIIIINMFHVFALTYYILLRCVTRKYTTTNDKKYSIYATHEYTTIFDLHDAYYSLLERYMKHVFVAGLVTGDFFSKTSGCVKIFLLL